jgi:D-alanyl-D-alanine carboxypeptidase
MARTGWYILPAVLLLSSCFPAGSRQQAGAGNFAAGGNAETSGSAETSAGDAGPSETSPADADSEPAFVDKMRHVLSKALIPGDLSRRIMAAAMDGPHFILDLLSCLEGDPYLRRLVDKTHTLPDGYEPDDLVELTGGAYLINRPGLMLRRDAAGALAAMAAAAQAEGVTLLVSSTYRSYDYQAEVYARTVRQDGQEAADRVSARPGRSQHQTGLAMDLGSIDDTFAQTPAGHWMPANAARFGWSLSFPQGYEAITGYVWESWHYRYVGPELAAFIDTYFDGIQQYALRFIHEWENYR